MQHWCLNNAALLKLQTCFVSGKLLFSVSHWCRVSDVVSLIGEQRRPLSALDNTRCRRFKVTYWPDVYSPVIDVSSRPNCWSSMREVDGVKAYTASDPLDVLPTACAPSLRTLQWCAKTETEKNRNLVLEIENRTESNQIWKIQTDPALVKKPKVFITCWESQHECRYNLLFV